MNSKPTERIPAFEYRGSIADYKQELLEAFARVLDSGQLILGPEVAAFEREFSQFVGARCGVGVSSGTDAIIIALRACGLQSGDEIITVANGPVPTVSAIRAVGATARFVDIDPVTLQMSVQQARAAITPRTRCILPIHLYGYPADAEALSELCRHHNLVLIEDCAQAHGTRLAAQHVGTFGQVGCFSFYPTKNLGAFGDAGMCVTNDDELASRLRQIACYGFRGDRIAHTDGLNCRLDELQAAALRVRMRYLTAALERRHQIAQMYLAGLREGMHPKWNMRLPASLPNGKCAWHQFVIRTPQRDALIAQLASQSIEVGIHYAHPVHLMPAYRDWGYTPGSLPVTETACKQVLSLPIYPELSDQSVQRILATLGELIPPGRAQAAC